MNELKLLHSYHQKEPLRLIPHLPSLFHREIRQSYAQHTCNCHSLSLDGDDAGSEDVCDDAILEKRAHSHSNVVEMRVGRRLLEASLAGPPGCLKEHSSLTGLYED